MTRVPYLNDLVTYLKSTPLLDKLGVAATTNCLGGRNIIVKSQYRGIDEDNQFGCAVWVHPMETVPRKKSSVDSDCPTFMVHRLMLMCVVKNDYNCRNHFEPNVVDPANGTIEMVGAYTQAAEIEECLIAAIRDFNETVAEGLIDPKSYSRLQICEAPEPDEHNGHLILPMVWELEYVL